MSTLKVTNIQATGETASRAVSGVAAAFVNFRMETTNTINSSINVSSCTDNATGNFICNYTNNMSDALYSCATGIRDGSGENDTRMITGSVDVAYYTSSSSRWVCGTHSATASALTPNDPYMAFLQIYGDLA